MPRVFNNIYQFERELGKGGFGTVFLAREDISHRRVAIKQLNDQDAKRQKDIVHEMQMVSRFNHPNIVTYHHHFSEDGLLFIVMEYCVGGSVRDAITCKKVSPTEALSWIQTLADALDFVHGKNIVHHDIKPDNILLADNGVPKLSDFGIANTGGGTRRYMSPEALAWDENIVLDARVDIYALGVTLMELLTGQNPFAYKSPDEIQAIHDKGEFPIKSLPGWQQEIILRAINKVPELRFQSMRDFSDAIRAKHVPLVLDREAIRAGQVAERAERSLSTRKWTKAGPLLEFAAQKYPANVNVLRALGRFHLMQQNIGLAKSAYEAALKLNPRMDVQKALGWINLAVKNYPAAISLLGDHLHRNPSDLEAHNLLLQCFYETDRYELAMSYARSMLEIDPNNPCFANNYYIAVLLHHLGEKIPPPDVRGEFDNDFIAYNKSVANETVPTHAGQNAPTLKSKLLFMDYRFRKQNPGPLYLYGAPNSAGKPKQMNPLIVTFGREGYPANDVEIHGGTNVSRRHCLVVNSHDDVWLYDLASTGTYVNGKRVHGKVLLTGRNTVRIGNKEFTITNDKDSLV